MYLSGKVQTAQISGFFDGMELAVVDKDVKKPGGGRPQYNCKVKRGWPGVAELLQMKKEGATVEQLADFARNIQLPAEDQVVPLIVLDITGKQGFKTLVCEVAAQQF